jgi:hypothetical protein
MKTSLGSQFEPGFRTRERPYYSPEYVTADQKQVLRQQKLR